MPKYCYSFDEESYHGKYDTREEALAEALSENNSYAESNRFSNIYTAECDTKFFVEFLQLDSLWECMSNVAYDEIGEFSEGWPEVSEDAEKELTDFMVEWAKKYKLEPTFYGVINIEKHPI